MVYGKDSFSWRAGVVWPLSGTPVTKHAGEFWPMVVAIRATRMTYEQFCRHFCDYDWTKTKIVGTKQSRIPELRALLAPLMLRRTRKQVAPEMPEIGFEFLAIDPVSKVDLASELEDEPTRKEVAIAKALPLVEEIAGCLERGDYKQTVVFAWHRDAIDAVARGLRARNVVAVELWGGRPESIRTRFQEDFKDGRTQVLVCQIIAAGTAIDLSVASHGYFLELDWVPGNNMQAANRLVSMMKDEPVTFDICTAPGTIDDRVQRILLRRSQELRTIL
jgi:SNF2 family DNA or RNA helicase